jgi:AcrR family transcriptional regulator
MPIKRAKRKRASTRGPHPGEGAKPKILRAAITAFGRDGYDGANIGAIADDAGVVKPLIHYHFETKEQLWYQTVQFALEQLTSEMVKLPFELQGLDPVEGFKLVIKKYAYFSAHHPWIARMIFAEVVRDTPRSKWIRTKFQDPVYGLFESMWNKLIASHGFRKIHARHVLPIVNGAIFAFTADSGIIEDRYDLDATDPAAMEQHAQVVVDVLLHGLMTNES